MRIASIYKKSMASVCLILLFLHAPLLSTELQQLAEAMEPGTWSVLSTNGFNQEFLQTRGDNAASFSILQYANKAQWDPNTEQFLFLGSPHDNPFKFIIYEAKSNSWKTGPLPHSCMEHGLYHGGCWIHSYYYSAIDPDAGMFYFYFSNGIAEYNISSRTWRQLPDEIDNGAALYGGLSYFPKTRNFVYVAGQYGLFGYDMMTLSWKFLDNVSMGDYHNISLYNPVFDIVLFGGGNGSRAVYRMASDGAVTSLGNAPQPLVLCYSIVTLDPVSGNYLICFDDGSFYEFDALKNIWISLPDPPSRFYTSIDCGTGAIAAPISNYGVTMFVTYDPAQVFIYKHSASSYDEPRVASPVIEPNGGVFEDSVHVQMATETQTAQIHYTIDGTRPTTNDPLYENHITLKNSTVINAFAVKQGFAPSFVTQAQFTIKTDTIAPYLLSVIARLEPASLLLRFSEPIDSESAENRDNYNIDQNIQVLDVELLQDRQTVGLDISPIQVGVEYELTIDNIQDLASTPNSIASNTRFVFRAEGRVETGLLSLYTFTEGGGSRVADQSGILPAAHLTINNPEQTRWGNDFLELFGPTVLKAASKKIVNTCRETHEFSIEAWVRPAVGVQSGPARIVTLSKNAYARNFTLGQTEEGLQVRLRTTTTDLNGMDAALSANLPVSNELMQIVYTCSSTGETRLYANMQELAKRNVSGDFSNWEPFELALGNELDGGRPWQGEYHLVSLYSRALTTEDVQQNFYAGPYARLTTAPNLDNTIPSRLRLEQNYPNPFNSKTRFQLSLPANDYVRINIFSLDGKRVEHVFAGPMQKGTHTVEWDAKSHSSGVYVYRVTTRTESIARKMICIK